MIGAGDAMATVLFVIALINAAATIALWRQAVRRPARPTKQFIKTLLHSEPVVPKHGRPTKWSFYADDEAHLAKYSRTRLGAVRAGERAFFQDFADFGEVMNDWLHCLELPWRLQELPDNELQMFSQEPPPSYGRRYLIFHNQARLGRLEMEVHDASHYTENNPTVSVAIELHSVRLIELETLRGLLEAIAAHVTDYHRECTEQTNARTTIDRAIQGVLWNTQHVSELDPELNETDWGGLECRFQGTALWYFQRREATRAQGEVLANGRRPT
jgi:hypothetical protein